VAAPPSLLSRPLAVTSLSALPPIFPAAAPAQLRPHAVAGRAFAGPAGAAAVAAAAAATWCGRSRVPLRRRHSRSAARVRIAATATATAIAAPPASGAAATGSGVASEADASALLNPAWERAMKGKTGDVWTEPQMFADMVGPLNAADAQAVGSLRFERVSAQEGAGDVVLYVPGVDFAGVSAAQQFRGLAREGHELWRCFVGPEDRTPFETMVRHLEVWVRNKIAAGRRVVLLGESFGGLLSLAAALRLGAGGRAGALKGLVLVNPATSFERTPWSLLGRALTALPLGDPLPPLAARTDLELLEETRERLLQTPYAYLGSMALAASVADPAQLGRIASKVVTTMFQSQREDSSTFSSSSSADGAGRSDDEVNPMLRSFLTYPEQIAKLLPPDTVRFRLRAWLRDGCESVSSELRLSSGRQSLPPTLLALSGGDRLLASGTEGKRLGPLLERRISGGRKRLQVVDLGPDIGHAPLDGRTDLAKLLRESPVYQAPASSRDYVKNYEPPTLEALEEGSKNIEAISSLVSPVFCSVDPATGARAFGLAGVPDPAAIGRPVILVGNHQLLALDLGPLVVEFLVEKGFAPRGLAHPINFPDVISELISDSTAFPAEPERLGPLDALGLPFELRATARASLEAAQALSGGEQRDSRAAAPPMLRRRPSEAGSTSTGGGGSSSSSSSTSNNGVEENFGLNGGFAKWGAVPVTPRNFIDLLARGEAILLFPGGTREACHGPYDKYKLFWPEKTDFVRAAAKYNAIVVPFGSVGSADNVQFIPQDWGALEPLRMALPGPLRGGSPDKPTASPFSLAVKSGGLMPVSESLQTPPSFPGVVPRLPTASQDAPGFGDRFYFSFGKPVDLSDINPKDRESCDAVYEELQHAVEGEISWLLQARTRDPYRDFLRRQAYERIANLDNAPRTVGGGPLKGGEIRSCGRRAPSFPL